ncbi:MAG TPA: class I SAM-dependent methyltransferase [Chthoniobacter sp.]|jgi:SAM-dependent methyltransferase
MPSNKGMSANVYDTVPYPSAVYPQTHPDRLAVIGTLYGLDVPPVERCRVLELGCGDGWNLIAMAYGLPGSEFVGVDTAASPIAHGAALTAGLGLSNLSLRHMDVAAAAELGEFDYIIAHGLFSWVAEPVREQILQLCERCLAPSGVAYVSYNAYPGNHLRDLVRGMMRYHIAHFADPEEKVRQGRALVKFLASSQEPRHLYHQILAHEVDRFDSYTDAGILHDDLSPNNQPFYFHEFMAQASAHGLQFLAEADMPDNAPRSYPPHVEAALANLDPADVVVREQYVDFLRGRPFRQTLLCRREQHRLSAPLPERVMRLRAAGDIHLPASAGDPHTHQSEILCGLNGSEIECDQPLIKSALLHLGTVWPECLAFDELLDRAAAAGTDQPPDLASSLATDLVRAYAAGFLQLRAHRPPLSVRPALRPRTSALARLQLRSGNRVTSLLHTIVQIDDPLGRALVQLLDGSRDRAMLEIELANVADTSGQPITAEALEASLCGLGRRALLFHAE